MPVLIRPSPWLVACLALVVAAGCGGGGSGGSAAPVDPANPPRPPLVELHASPPTVIAGKTAELTWSATNATQCSASGAWGGARPVSGTERTPPISGIAAFDLSCTGPGGAASTRITIDTVGPPNPPLAIQAAYGDGSVTVSWQSLAGSSYAGSIVTTNIYVSSTPNIDVRNFVPSGANQVRRGLTTMLAVVFRGFANGKPVYVVATDVADGVESVPSREISVTPQPVPSLVENVAALNDTGVDRCADLTYRGLACPIAGLPGQDAEHGRDATATAGQLAKTGFGRAGFDFTKLDAAGNALPNDAPTWSCIRDNVTGLIWEVPTDSGLTASSGLYSWYQPDPLRNGGDPGEANAGGQCTGSACDTHAFLEALNADGLCGFQDWRLPTRRELISLADYSRARPAIPFDAFPHVPTTFNAFFWTSGTSAYTSGIAPHAWGMDVSTGIILSMPKSPDRFPGSILAVRAAPRVAAAAVDTPGEVTCLARENTSIPYSTPRSNYTVLDDGTVAAPGTGLMWKRCLEGQTLSGNVCAGAPAAYTWAEALGAARASAFAGHDDWRVPNPKELLSIIEDRCAAPALNGQLFPMTELYSAWSATPNALFLTDEWDEPWVISFDGVVIRYSKYQTLSLLLVRDLP